MTEHDITNDIVDLGVFYGLTDIHRKIRNIRGDRFETSAEHTFHVVLCAVILSKHCKLPINKERVISMLAIHDLIEIMCGDISIFEIEDSELWSAVERRTAKAIFRRNKELLDLWEEFEDNKTDDARLAKALDRIQPLVVECLSDRCSAHNAEKIRQLYTGFEDIFTKEFIIVMESMVDEICREK